VLTVFSPENSRKFGVELLAKLEIKFSGQIIQYILV
jgi:hypothetical protein